MSMRCALLMLLLVGCSGGGSSEDRAAETNAAETNATETNAAETNVVFFGDSLTEGYKLGDEKPYPTLIQEKITEAGLPFIVINAGKSADTTATALPRLPEALQGEIALVFIALGTNDVRKRFEIEAIRARFQTIVTESRRLAPGATIALGGVDAFSGAPPAYVDAFNKMLGEFAAENGLPYLPSPLAHVHGVPELNLPDGLHPNAAGHRIIADNVWDFIQPLLLER